MTVAERQIAELLLALIDWSEAVNGPAQSEVRARAEALRSALAVSRAPPRSYKYD